MKIYEVLNYFDRTRYFVSAKTEEEMLELVDKEFIKKLNEITDDYDEEEGEGQYDDLRNSKTERMKEISYKLMIEDATKPVIVEKNLKGDLDKFYF